MPTQYIENRIVTDSRVENNVRLARELTSLQRKTKIAAAAWHNLAKRIPKYTLAYNYAQYANIIQKLNVIWLSKFLLKNSQLHSL